MTEQQHGLVDQLLQYYLQYSHQGLVKSSHLYDVHYNIPPTTVTLHQSRHFGAIYPHYGHSYGVTLKSVTRQIGDTRMPSELSIIVSKYHTVNFYGKTYNLCHN